MATTCEHCQNYLFDYVYGLLEENEIQEVREHLTACSSCQTALEKVQAQHHLLSRAAKAITVVPEFALPQDEPATVAQTPVAEEPRQCEETAKRSLWRRPWIAWTTAIALLLTVSAAISWHRRTIQTYEKEVASHRQEYRKVEEQLATLPAQYQTVHQATLSKLRAEAKPYLSVIGPTQLQAGTTASLHITTRHPEGDLAAAKILVKLVETSTNQTVQETSLASTGDVRVEVSAARMPANSKAHIIVEAETHRGRATVQESVDVPAAQFVSRIDTSKIAYQTREVLFFRVVVLDRYTLTPPSQPILLQVKLLNPENKAVKQLATWTGAGGILAGELALQENYSPGHYQLEVGTLGEIDTSVAVVGASTTASMGSPLPQGAVLRVAQLLPGRTTPSVVETSLHRLEILRGPQSPEIFLFDKDRYYPGEVFSAMVPDVLDTPESGTLKIGDKVVPFTLEPRMIQARGAMAPGMAMGGGGSQDGVGGPGKGSNPLAKKAAEGQKAAGISVNKRRLIANVPKDVPAGAKNLPVTLQFKKAHEEAEIKADLALQPTDYAIDFFPEGGDLIAGIPNRVFYRIRSQTGEAITGDGRVILMTGKNEVIDSRYRLGLGYLDFTPNARETYTARITSPVTTTEVPQPFQNLGIRPFGVVLHIPGKKTTAEEQDPPAAVGKQGEPIHVTLRNQGPPGKMLLVAQCRGQILDQRWIDAKTGSGVHTLQTLAAHGMIRVTAYELEGTVLQPVAERLAYRTPSHSINLGMTLDKQHPRPGEHLRATLSARNEKGEPTAAWLLASVVDERYQGKPRSLAEHFLLLNEIRSGADMDDAQILLRNSPESAQMLECFLGTHGWRRFVRTQETGKNNVQAAAPMIFSRENVPFATLQKQYEERRSSVLSPISQAAFHEQVELQDQQIQLTQAISALVRSRYHFEEQVQTWIRFALGCLLALMLLASLVLMMVGAYRILRQHKTATPMFGGSFVGLAACLVMMMLGNHLGPMGVDAPQMPTGPSVAVLDAHRNKLAEVLGKVPVLRRSERTSPAGTYAMLQNARQEKAVREPVNAQKQDNKAQPTLLAMTGKLGLKAFNDREYRFGGTEQQMQPAAESKVMRERFEAAQMYPASPVPAPAAKDAAALGQSPQPPRGAIPAIDRKANPIAPVAPPIASNAVPAAPEGVRTEMAGARRPEYAHEHAPQMRVRADTLLWSPALWLANGTVEVRFDTGSGQASYRVILLGHAPNGSFGMYESRLDVWKEE